MAIRKGSAAEGLLSDAPADAGLCSVRLVCCVLDNIPPAESEKKGFFPDPPILVFFAKKHKDLARGDHPNS